MNIEFLTPKDCLYLEDLMNQSYTFIKRLENESTMLTTPELQSMQENVIKEMKELFQMMLSIIKEVN